ncbi:acetyl-CoA carboxylase biotin carboxylase subunit [Actinoplanes sp. NBRC 14428]|nr:acetyl-CoA carboxylase biotin carboxylase subunit [Actinoplanes sp. NBRC 14428]
MFDKVLIANRGEIALRVVRACRELGIRSVVVYSTADAASAAVRAADEAVHIGPPPAKASYLHVPNVIEAALKHGVDAIHPGYGFLSEDVDFAEVCSDNDLVFIGPDPEVMRLAGDKVEMRARMITAGLPVLPGSVGAVATVGEAEEIAADIGYPVVVKASAGGGGRGITRARDRAELQRAFTESTTIARALFGAAEVYVESFVDRARHIEVQIMADRHEVVHVAERDCSLQRRRQKLVEETPSALLTPAQREQVTGYAVRGARSIGYLGAGTMEFLVRPDGRATFMELNGRIQVEHPVTEMATGIDLVREQLRIASGERLSFRQDQVVPRGAAIECRINAEDPAAGFRPTPGLITSLRPAGGPFVRVDSGVEQGDTIAPYYDSLLAKLIVWAPDRDAAIARMTRALDEFEVEGPGVRTTIPLARRLIDTPEFRAGEHTTDFVDAFLARAAEGGTP